MRGKPSGRLRREVIRAVAAVIGLGSILFAQSTPPMPVGPLAREYREGERLTYRMKASNRGRLTTTVYEATARGVVKRDAGGTFYEEFEWSDMVWNGAGLALPEASRGFRQLLSLAPDHTPALPDFSTLHPRLVGPTSDLMTFYADVWLAMRQPALREPGDEIRVANDNANSWADGTRVVLGEDAIDFVLTLGDASPADDTRGLTVRHVPPEQPKVRLPADWMRTPVADVPNNWVQVIRLADRRYIASVGKETFDARIRLSTTNGRIVSADLENPVEVLERECTDNTLTECGEATRYRILRQIRIAEVP